MKYLYIIRHGHANFGDPRYADYDNPLTDEGLKQAKELGKALALQNVKPNVVLSSTAKRAITTARLIVEELRLGEEVLKGIDKLYNALDIVILDVVRNESMGNVVIVVGHNPGISAFCNKLLGVTGVLGLGTCEVVKVSLPIENWKELEWGSGKLM